MKGTDFESLGFSFELPGDLVGNVFAVRVMRVQYDHYSKMCKSYRIPPKASKDIPSYYEQMNQKIEGRALFLHKSRKKSHPYFMLNLSKVSKMTSKWKHKRKGS